MPEPHGRYYPISPFRRLVIDLMHFSTQVPCATVERRMALGPLVAARHGSPHPPSWSALFAKAYALVAARTPPLRMAYLTFPRPRFYVHPVSIATINVDRQVGGERVVLYAHVRCPDALPLRAIDAVIRHHQDTPVEQLPSYRHAVRLSRVPWPLRRPVFWAALNVLGPIRCRHFGTFALSSVCALGAGLLHLIPLLTSELHYGMLDGAGHLDVRLSFDHRVIDGAVAAQALADLDATLLGPILDECAGAAGETAGG